MFRSFVYKNSDFPLAFSLSSQFKLSFFLFSSLLRRGEKKTSAFMFIKCFSRRVLFFIPVPGTVFVDVVAEQIQNLFTILSLSIYIFIHCFFCSLSCVRSLAEYFQSVWLKQPKIQSATIGSIVIFRIFSIILQQLAMELKYVEFFCWENFFIGFFCALFFFSFCFAYLDAGTVCSTCNSLTVIYRSIRYYVCRR